MCSRWTPRANALSLSFLRTEARPHLSEASSGLDQGAGGQEAAELVHGEKGLFERSDPRNSGVGGMGETSPDDFLRPFPLRRGRPRSAGCSSGLGCFS